MNNVQIEMELRFCKNCQATFKVMTTSKQTVCGTSCEFFGLGAPKKALPAAKSARESVTVSVTEPTRPSNPAKAFAAKTAGWPLPKRKQKDHENIMSETEIAELDNVLNGAKKTASDNSPIKESGMPKTKTASEPSSMLTVVHSTQSEDSTPQSQPAALVTSQSMNLLDDTATHLHDLMKGLHGNRPPADVQLYDPDRVNAACNCAKNIREIMKLKLEAIKIQLANK